MTSFAYATTPPRKTSLEPATDVSRAATSPPVHDSAVASVRPRSRHAVEHERLDRPLVVARRGTSRAARRARASSCVGARLGARLDEQVDVDLEVARADRRLDPVAVAAGVVERLRDGRLGDAVEAQHAPLGRPRAREQPPQRLGLERLRPERLQLARRPGQHHRDRVAGLEHERRRGARRAPSDDRALGHGRLLAHARREVRVRPLQPLGDARETRLDLRLELRVDDERAPGGAREQLDRAVVVRRPEPARDDERSCASALAQRRLELVRVVADDPRSAPARARARGAAARGTGR